VKYLDEFCAAGAMVRDEMMDVSDEVSLRVLTFTPPGKTDKPVLVFVAGWISMIDSWQKVLKELSKNYLVYYIETREKGTSHIRGKVQYGVEDVGGDVIALIRELVPADQEYFILGSSLGATAVLDFTHELEHQPLCLVLVGPNAEFRVPLWLRIVIKLFYPPFWFVLRPALKWYLRTSRMEVKADRAQYEKYCRTLDGADPWKLKSAAISLWGYDVWDKLPAIKIPVLIVGASSDKLHEPENLKKMTEMLPSASYLDLETNSGTHSVKMVEEMNKYLNEVVAK